MQNNKIIFSGDSFTWGQGIQYYGNFNDIKIMPDNQYIYSYLTKQHIEYIKENRYAKLVSNHFNCKEIVKPDNGGSDDESIKFIYDNIDGDVKVVILQTTQPARSTYSYFYKNEERIICGSSLHLDDNNESKIFREYLIEKNIDVDDWYIDLKKQITNKIKDLAIFLESKNIKFIILPWTNDYIENFRNEPQLFKHLLKINYNNFTYSCIQSLMSMNQEFFIKSDYKNLGSDPPPDHHMSLNCHKLIANILIENLKDTITN